MLLAEVRRRKKAGQKVVFTNGCFDLLHVGHIRLLNACSRLGDYLVVGAQFRRRREEAQGAESADPKRTRPRRGDGGDRGRRRSDAFRRRNALRADFRASSGRPGQRGRLQARGGCGGRRGAGVWRVACAGSSGGGSFNLEAGREFPPGSNPYSSSTAAGASGACLEGQSLRIRSCGFQVFSDSLAGPALKDSRSTVR